MPAEPQEPIFLDTSIQIGRMIHRPEIRDSINNRVRRYSAIESSLIVRQEFKRRLLKDARYLLMQLNERKSFERARRHVTDSLPKALFAKMKICLNLFDTIDETDTDADRYDRARFMLRDLIRNGIETAEAQLTSVRRASGCACALQPIVEKKKYFKYDLGQDRCSKTGNRCRIRQFLESHQKDLRQLHDFLATIPSGTNKGEKSPQLVRAQEFIRKFLENPEGVEDEDPCLTVGDLLIALESAGCGSIYTMNAKDSQHLARAMGQSMICNTSAVCKKI